jgi:hypothetical protein
MLVGVDFFLIDHSSETVGDMDPFVELSYWRLQSQLWGYQTVVHENHGTSSNWVVDQSFLIQPRQGIAESSVSVDSLKIRVKDKNNLKPDTAVGKATISCDELASIEWSDHVVVLRDKNGRNSGEILLRYRSAGKQLTPDLLMPSFPSLLMYLPHIDSSLSSNLIKIENICQRNGIKCSEWQDIFEDKPGPSIISRNTWKITIERSPQSNDINSVQKFHVNLLLAARELSDLDHILTNN